MRLLLYALCIGFIALTFPGPGKLVIAQVADPFAVDDDDEEPSPWATGLLLTQKSIVSPQPALVVPRLFASNVAASKVAVNAAEQTELVWSGRLETEASGEYRIALKFRGEVTLELNGKRVLEAQSRELKWVESEPISLNYDFHSLRLFLKQGEARSAGVTAFWAGPRFRYEPIPAKRLWHQADASAVESDDVSNRPSGDTAVVLTSEQLLAAASITRALRCEACHNVHDRDEAPLRASDLSSVAANVKTDWLVGYFMGQQNAKADTANAVDAAFRAVHGNFSANETADLIAWLREFEPEATRTPQADSTDTDSGDVARGKRLFATVGCVACHSWKAIRSGDPAGNPFGGGDLTGVANKRPREFFRRWLRSPESINANHRMPEFELTDQELTDLSSFLAATGSKTQSPSPGIQLDDGNAQRGRALAEANNCSACHATGKPARTRRIEIPADADWSKSCLSPSTSVAKPGQPRYRLDESTRQQVMDFLARPNHNQLTAGELLMHENNCVQCHQRGTHVGLAPAIAEVAGNIPELVDRLGALKPPALNSVGDKLHARVLRSSITRNDKPLRTWLDVRMPRFPLDDEAVDTLVAHFIDVDRVPDEAYADRAGEELADAASEVPAFADRLVTSDGFGCISCHAIGNVAPSAKTPLNQLGPSLSMPQQRLRKIWFDRWVRDPARITPRMEMPSVQIPIPGVMHEDLDAQLDAVWQILNVRRFSPPDPSPTRIVSRRGLEGSSERATVLTDVLRLQGRKLIKPLLVGLGNRHNVLFDLSTARLASWWTGDVARQRTQGKTWYWEPASINPPETSSVPSLALFRDGVFVNPVKYGQAMAELDEWSQIPRGIEFQYRLRFAVSTGESDAASHQPVRVTERITAVDTLRWRRTVSVTGLSADEAIGLHAGFGAYEVTGTNADAVRRVGDRLLLPANDGTTSVTLTYTAEQPPSEYAADALPDPITLPARELNVMPGFRLTQLPLRSDVMPISLGWKENGDLVVGSLKGRVWLARDSDGDGLEDQIRPVSDDLASPYGINTQGDFIDVATKSAIVRLSDTDGDAIVDRHQVVASGWGHTDDYHDWIVGLPRDRDGNYYVSIPCQQDDRDSAAARFRGTVLQVTPRPADAKSPRLFDLRQVSAGHRFPMGIAINRTGNVFVTDNQGNYNPYNELNHVVDGARFGFINKVDREPGFNPELTPPAIDIPHPWTRSVNGICFLETPSSAEDEAHFGPFEGHLIGCEYDTRRLIRMSLEEVNGWMQGAAYPFAVAAEMPANGFQGPINCGIAPDGDLYIANIRDSGWGGANNTGSIVRITPDLDQLPAGIAEVSLQPKGFRITFTRPVNRELASDPGNYRISSVRRISTPAYGGDDVDRREEPIGALVVAPDRMSVEVQLQALRPGFVYEFGLKSLVSGDDEFFPAEAFYTVRRLRD